MMAVKVQAADRGAQKARQLHQMAVIQQVGPGSCYPYTAGRPGVLLSIRRCPSVPLTMKRGPLSPSAMPPPLSGLHCWLLVGTYLAGSVAPT